MRSVLLTLVVAGLLCINYTVAICNNCENGHACISKNEYQLCFKGVRDTSATYKCPNASEICTKFRFICMNPAEAVNLEPGCGDLSKCGKCDGLADGLYTCTSRTTFTMCFKGNLTDVRATCPPNQLCDVTKAAEGNPCVSKCSAANAVLCDTNERVDEPPVVEVPTTTTTTTTTETTTTEATTTEATTTEATTTEATTTETIANDTTTIVITEPTDEPITTTESSETTISSTATTTTVVIAPTPQTTPATTPQNAVKAVCAARTSAGRYPYINDTVCRDYVYCYWSAGSLQGTPLTCPGTLYFNAQSSLCEAAKPAGCL